MPKALARYHVVRLSGRRLPDARDENPPDMSYLWHDADVESAKMEISQERLVSIFLAYPSSMIQPKFLRVGHAS